MPTQTQEDSMQQSSDDQNRSQEAKPDRGGSQGKNGKTVTGDETKVGQKQDGRAEDDHKEDAGDQQETQPMDPAKKRRRIIMAVVIGAVLFAGGLLWYLHSLTYEDTDDAQIDGHFNAIASRVAGTIVGVYVENDQPVKVGQPLVDLDPKDYQVSASQARANYEQAVAQAAAQNPNVPITVTSNQSTIDVDDQQVLDAQAALASAERDYDSNVAKLHLAEANNRKSQADLLRYKELVAKEEIAKSDFDQYIANADSGDANVEAARFAAASSAKIVDQRKAQLLQQQAKYAQDNANSPRQIAIQQANVKSRFANVDSAKAQLDSALLNLSYCHIVAPVDGIATERSAEVGGRVSAGQQLIMVVQTESVWVTANFKETQLRKMRVGQPVKIKVDSLGESFDGQVELMPAATGDRASLFPAENATGNYVKIVQRLPVRIRIDQNQKDFDKLRPGMSVEPEVYLDR